MDIFAPSYYKDFKCTADKCEHNCCIGWEIDIDEKSLEFYKNKPFISKHICTKSPAHFILDKNNRCPFLNKHNLCKIMKKYGEDALCQICSDHPRFINRFENFSEIGLGLTCEAAAKLILDNDFKLIKLCGSDYNLFSQEEVDFINYRNTCLKKGYEYFKVYLPKQSIAEILSFLKGLERLDTNFDTLLESIPNQDKALSDIIIEDTAKANRLFSYFVFRHLYNYGIEICVFCTYFIMASKQDIYEFARMFSSEIEYSDENIEKILQIINK